MGRRSPQAAFACAIRTCRPVSAIQFCNFISNGDIHETDDAKAYRFAVELPGFQKDEIHVDVKDGYLTVSAQKGLDKDEEDKKGRVLRQERYAGACSRSFYVGDVKAEDVKAKYESGVLTVLIPKKEPKKIVSGTSVIVE